MAEVSEQQVRDALGGVVDPDSGQDVISGGMVGAKPRESLVYPRRNSEFSGHGGVACTR